jgi:16S rRNA (guanine527-N7)-methyltransferase
VNRRRDPGSASSPAFAGWSGERAEDLLASGLEKLGISASGTRMASLLAYYRELELWNGKYGLVNARGVELIIRHFLDSLAPLGLIRDLLSEAADRAEGPGGVRMPAPPPALADVGSGAGFPGIPLACVMEEVGVNLIERSARRCLFLSNALAMIGLKNVVVTESDTERVAGVFDLVVLRAYKPLDQPTYAALERLRAAGGAIAAYKGRNSAIRTEFEELARSVPDFEERESVRVEPVQVPFLDEERNLVILRRRKR